MFRVKLQVPPDLAQAHVERVKTGVRGVGYVKVDDTVSWPADLDRPFPPEDTPADASPGR